MYSYIHICEYCMSGESFPPTRHMSSTKLGQTDVETLVLEEQGNTNGGLMQVERELQRFSLAQKTPSNICQIKNWRKKTEPCSNYTKTHGALPQVKREMVLVSRHGHSSDRTQSRTGRRNTPGEETAQTNGGRMEFIRRFWVVHRVSQVF